MNCKWWLPWNLLSQCPHMDYTIENGQVVNSLACQRGRKHRGEHEYVEAFRSMRLYIDQPLPIVIQAGAVSDALDRLEELLNAASPGPWKLVDSDLAPPRSSRDDADAEILRLSKSVLREALTLARAVRVLLAQLERNSALEDTDYVDEEGRAVEESLNAFEASVTEGLKAP